MYNDILYSIISYNYVLQSTMSRSCRMEAGLSATAGAAEAHDRVHAQSGLLAGSDDGRLLPAGIDQLPRVRPKRHAELGNQPRRPRDVTRMRHEDVGKDGTDQTRDQDRTTAISVREFPPHRRSDELGEGVNGHGQCRFGGGRMDQLPEKRKDR